MGNLAKGATTPKSIKQAAAKVAKIMDAAESSARRQINVNKLGVRKELDEFFRVTKIVEAEKNSDYYMLHLVEGTRKYNPFKVSVPILASDLSFNYVGQTYLEEGMSHADVDHKSMVSLLKVANKHLNEESIVDDKGEPVEYYIYGFQVLRYFVTEKPTEKWSSVDIVDDNGEVLHEGVYLKKRLVRADGSAVDQS